MSKFNLKDYKKTPGDEHIDRRLQDSHKTAPDQINEVQLEDYRSPSPETLIEKTLENKRLGGADEITEKRLDDHKAKFANKYRNPDAYSGDINKLEEKRLKNDPVEKEKYEVASECGKQLRWWEGVKSPDGLKVAQTEKKIKVAQVDDPAEKGFGVEDDDEPNIKTEQTTEQIAEQVAEEAGQELNKEQEASSRAISEADSDKISIIKWKDLPNPQRPYLSGLYVVLSYDPTYFGGDEERIKQAALGKVISVNESLDEKIFTDDFYDVREEGGEGTLKLRAVGEDFAPVVSPPSDATSIPETKSTRFLDEGKFSEIGYQEKDIDGTPMAMGRVIITEKVTPENMDNIVLEALEFIRKKHPHLQIDEESLDLLDLESKGQIGYAVGIMLPEEFPVREASSKKKWIGIK